MPVGIVVETVTYYPSAAQTQVEADPESAATAAEAYLYTQMISGEILDRLVTCEAQGEILVLTGRYVCREMIGMIRQEENISDYG